MGRKSGSLFLVILGIILLILPYGGISEYMIRFLAIIFLWVGKTGCWNIVSGYTGYIDFGSVGYFGIGAYVTGLLMTRAHVPFVPSLLLSGLTAGLVAIPIGLPTLRLRGAYFGIATLAFAEALKQIVLEFDQTVGIHLFEGPHGITLPLGPGNEFFYYAGLVVMVTVVGINGWIERSKFGFALRAIRESEQTAELSGVDTLKAKTEAYVISAFFLGIIGSLEAYWLTYITPHMVFDVLITIQMIVMALLGGMGTLAGPILGATFLTILYELLYRDFPYTYGIIVGFIILGVVLLMPHGVVGSVRGKRRERRVNSGV